jgi:predicted nucleic acid-binding protein
MGADWFVDTNVLVYSRDSSEPAKQREAEAWMRWLWTSRRGAVSVQVLQEDYSAVTRKLRHPIPRLEARRHVETLFAWGPIGIGDTVVRDAWQVEDRFGLSWWDGLIVGAARVAGCNYLLTEDLQDGQDLGGVTVVNPFRHVPPP